MPERPIFTLIVVATEDGFIARYPGHSPAGWASPEEQDLFFAEVGAADWGVMGRGTHEAADRPQRRRIVFTSAMAAPEWRRPTQLWLNPEGLAPDDLPPLVDDVRPMRNALILGATRVHDWFLAHGRIDRVLLTVEPISFGEGLWVFSHRQGPAQQVLAAEGFVVRNDQRLNSAGTRLLTMVPA